MDLETGDLLLRPWRSDDLRGARRVLGDQAASAEPWLAQRNGPGRDDWAVLEADEVVAHVALKTFEHGIPEIGYRTAPDARGRGLATAAARAVAAHAFAQGAPKIAWLARAGNEASWRVAHAVGFRYEGLRRGELPEDDGTRADAWSGGLLPGDLAGQHPLPWFPDPVLTDGDVLVRRFQEADLDAWLPMRNETDVVRRGHGGPSRRTLTRDEGWRSLFVDGVEQRMTGAGMDLAVVHRGVLAGNVGFRREGGGAVLSWWIGSAHRGHGLAGTAAALLADALRATGRVDRLEARLATVNPASERAAQRAGLVREGLCHRDSPWDDGMVDGWLYGWAP